MKNSVLKIAVAVSLALLWAISASAVRVESKQYNPITSRNKTTHDASAFLGAGEQAFSINLSDISVDPDRITGNKTGIVLPLPSSATSSLLHWESINGGYVARFRVSTNDQIRRVRLHLTFKELVPSISFRVQGNLDSSPIGPVDNTDIHDNAIWLPITHGNSTDLEIFVDEISPPDSLNFEIDAINLILTDLSDSDPSRFAAQRLGLASDKELDLDCYKNEVDVYPALSDAASATALIDFISDGFSFQCTGTLLNDMKGTGIPWFATANHCIPDQTTANTATFTWFFQATTCGESTTDSRAAQTSGGAQLLWTDVTLEASFLRLNNLPAPGTILSGWDSTSLQIGNVVWGVHHPNGDHTMVDVGNITGLRAQMLDEQGFSHTLNTVQYIEGNTELGSSGSGLFSIQEGNVLYWRGTLFGGNDQISAYSDFSLYYTNLTQWLSDPGVNCLFDWAEDFYPNLFSPRGAVTLDSSPYTYRYYKNTNAYVGVSSLDDHVYYLGPDGILMDAGDISSWLKEAGCS